MIGDGVGLTTDEQKADSHVWLTVEAYRNCVRMIDADCYESRTCTGRVLSHLGLSVVRAYTGRW